MKVSFQFVLKWAAKGNLILKKHCTPVTGKSFVPEVFLSSTSVAPWLNQVRLLKMEICQYTQTKERLVDGACQCKMSEDMHTPLSLLCKLDSEEGEWWDPKTVFISKLSQFYQGWSSVLTVIIKIPTKSGLGHEQNEKEPLHLVSAPVSSTLVTSASGRMERWRPRKERKLGKDREEARATEGPHTPLSGDSGMFRLRLNGWYIKQIHRWAWCLSGLWLLLHRRLEGGLQAQSLLGLQSEVNKSVRPLLKRHGEEVGGPGGYRSSRISKYLTNASFQKHIFWLGCAFLPVFVGVWNEHASFICPQ